MKTVVLVYSGGLDTSVAIPMMREDYGFERVVTVTVDVGQPADDITVAEEKARALGTEHYTVDAKDEFARDYCFRAVKANGDYQGYPLSTSIARPIIAEKAVEVAKRVGGQAFCHGCTGKGNDQFRIEFVMRTLAPEIEIIAPMRERNLTRTEEIEYARRRASRSRSPWTRSGALTKTSGGAPSRADAWKSRTTLRRRRFSSGRSARRPPRTIQRM